MKRVSEHANGFEEMISDLSAMFLKTPASLIDSQLEKGLRTVIEFFGLDRGILAQPGDEKSRLVITHSWAGPDILLVTGSSGPPENIPWVLQRLLAGKPVIFSRPEDLPDEAAQDREFFRGVGTKSHISLPLRLDEQVIGALSLCSVRRERAWPDSIVRRLEMLAAIFAAALERKRQKLELEERLRFEILLADLSTAFVNLPSEQLDLEMSTWVQRLAEFMKADRCTIGMFPESGSEAYMTHSWVAEGCKPYPISLDTSRWPWVIDQLKRGNPVCFSHLDDLPPEAALDRDTWEKGGTKSHLSLPLVGGGTTLGMVSFGMLRAHRTWPDTLIKRLQVVASLFAAVLARKQAKMVLHNFEERFQEFFRNVPDYCYMLSPEGNIVDINVPALGVLGCQREEVVGKHMATVFTSEHFPGLGRLFAKWKRHGKVRNEEMEIVSSDGERRSVLVSAGSVKAEDGTIMGSAIIQTDITERKKTEKELLEQLRKVEQLKHELEKDNIILRGEIKLAYDHGDIVGQSEGIKRVLALAEQVAPTDSTVLILGATGTGKELLAHTIHNLSTRKDRPFVKLNCASLPPSLIESELFGREKGAYTGAMTKMIGRLEAAHGSTLFLDEIGEISYELQAKLLQVIEHGRFERLGSTETIQVNIRFITATNRDLSKEVQEGKFRMDLFYRLNVFPILIPPLCERVEDIMALTWTFIKQFEKSLGKRIDSIPRKSMEALQRHSWPGNIRELKNVIERAMILSTGRVLEIAPLESVLVRESYPLAMEDLERKHIVDVLEKTGWRIAGRAGAAEILGMKRTTLQSKIKKLGIARPAQ